MRKSIIARFSYDRSQTSFAFAFNATAAISAPSRRDGVGGRLDQRGRFVEVADQIEILNGGSGGAFD